MPGPDDPDSGAGGASRQPRRAPRQRLLDVRILRKTSTSASRSFVSRGRLRGLQGVTDALQACSKRRSAWCVAWNAEPTYLIILATVIAILAGSFMSATPVARAADVPSGPCTIVWDGGAGTASWLDAANWTDDRLPTVADDACVYAASAPTTGITLAGASNQVVNSLRTEVRAAGEHGRRHQASTSSPLRRCPASTSTRDTSVSKRRSRLSRSTRPEAPWVAPVG